MRNEPPGVRAIKFCEYSETILEVKQSVGHCVKVNAEFTLNFSVAVFGSFEIF